MKTRTFGRFFRNLPALAFGATLLASAATGWGQTNWSYDFGTTNGTFSTASTISTNFLPDTPTGGGLDLVRVGSGGGSFTLTNVSGFGSGSALVMRAPTSTSVNKFSISDWTNATTAFTLTFDMRLVGGTNGIWYLFAGNGASFADGNAFTGNQSFLGLRFTYGTGGAITTSNRAANTWTNFSSGISQSNNYTISVFGNNGSTNLTYVKNGVTYTNTTNAYHVWVNNTLVGTNLAKAELANGTVIDSFMFYGESSTGNLATNIVDNFTYAAYLVSEAAATPTITAVTLTNALTNTYGTASLGVSYTATGTNLTGQITNTPVTGFEISTNNSAWTTNATAVNTNTTMWVRTAATRAAGTNNTTAVVTLASSGATSTNVTTSSSSNVVSRASLTITGLTAQSKDWDGTTTASVTGTPAYSGLVNSETFSITGSVTWAFADANVGTNKPLTRTGTYDAPSANYTVTQPTLTASIIAVAPGAPTITGITPGNQMLSVAFTAPDSNGGASISNYEYSIDGGNNWVTPNPAVISSPLLISGLNNDTAYGVQLRAINSAGSGSPSATTSGTPVAPNSPTITVSSATLSGTLSTTYGAASSSQSFTVSGATLDGNLTVSAPAGLEVSLAATSDYANSLDLTATGGVVPMTTIYVRLKAAAAAGSYNSQNITVSGGGATPQNVSTTSSGNAVAQAALTISGISIDNKIYDGTTTATITGTASYVGLQNGETFSVGGTPSAVFATNGNVGTGKSVTVSGYTAPSSNYAITQPTGLTANITAKELIIAGAAASNKVFDGTTTAAITGTLAGVVGADAVTLNGTGTFASVNVGAGIAVTSTSTLSGANAANYSLVQPTGLTADITQATQSITFGLLANANVGTTNGLTATASSGLAVSYTSANTNVASISGTNVIANAAGVTTITASQAGDSNVAAATPVSQTLNVVNTANLGTPTSTQNFGTSAATNTSQTASTSTITNPTSGTTYARAGATAPAAPIIVATNTPNPLGTSGAYLRAVASSSTSVAKASPIAGYTGGKEFYTSFKVLFGDSAGSTNATSGNWAFWQGAGANYTDAQQVGVSQAAVGLRFTYGSSGAISLSYAPTSGSTFLTNGLSSTSLTQGTVYNVEVVLFNGASGATKTYSYNGQTKTLSAGNCDIYINGVQFASNLTSGGLTLDTTINATTFTGVSSTSNAANLFVDDFVVYNTIPAAIGTGPGITPGGTFPALVTTYGTASSNNSVLVSGGSLTSNITATAPSGFQVSSDGTNWASTAIYTNSSNFASGSLFLRLNSNALAGTYSNQVVALTSGSAANSIAISNSTVNRYPITVGAVATNKVYGDADPALTYTNAPLLFSDTFSGSITRAAGNNAGAYAITQGTLTNANYNITFLTNDFTITPAALTITANNVIKPAGIALTTPQTGSTAFTSGGLVSGDSISSLTITYTDGASSEAPAGLYRGVVVPSAPLGINTNNYHITFNAGDLTVDATPTITVGTASLSAFSTTYGTDSSAQNFTVLGGSLPGSTLSVSAPAGFQVSTNSSSGFAGSVVLGVVSNAVHLTTIFARIPGTTGASTNLSGNIAVSSDSATTRNVSIPASTVSPKALTIGGLSATNRVYNATTNGTVTGTPVYVGLTNSQSFEVTDNVTWSFVNKNVGTNKALTPSTSYTAPSANYTISAQPSFSANITQATLSLRDAAATSRAYAAGNTNVTITGVLSGVFPGDTVGFIGTGTIASANAGTNIPVTANVTLTGADAGNYTLTQPTGLTVDITKASQTINFAALSNVAAGTTNALTATASSGLAVTYTSSKTNVATISGSNVIAVAAGVTTITASQTGDSNFEAATPAARTLNVAATPNTTTLLSENFNAMGTSSNLPTSFRIHRSSTPSWSSASTAVTEIATSNSMTAGGTYNFGATNNERAVGAMSSGSFASPSSLLAIVTNTSGATLTSVSVSYLAERFRINSSAASVQLFASTNGSTWVAITNGDTASTNFPTGSSSYTWASPTVITRSGIAVTNFSVTNNGLIYLRWNIETGGSSSQAIGIDDVTVMGAVQNPAITTSGSFLAVNTTYGTASAASASTVAVTGGSLTSNITATAPTGFEVSTNGVAWSDSASFIQTDGFADGTLYLRAAATASAGTYSNQTVSLTAGSASNNVSIATSTVAPKALAAGFTASKKTYDGTTAATVTGRSLSGVVGSDDVSLDGGTANFDDANAGIGKTVTLTGATLSGAAAGNYTLGSVSTTTADIDKATPTIDTAPTATAITAGQTLSASILTGGASVPGMFSWTTPSTIPVSSGVYNVTFLPSDAVNYNAVTTSANVTVNPADSGYSSWLGGAPTNSANQLKYAIGGASNALATNGVVPTTQISATHLSITAIVRTNDTNLSVFGQSIVNLATGTWTNNDVTRITDGVDQTGVPAGNQRQIFSSPRGADGRKFLRLQTTLSNQ
jgi:hypothetical protein